jgi:hypothetical protein
MRQATILLLMLAPFGSSALALPPLSDQQLARLETARDGRDHREEAFVALLENVRLWTGDIGDTPVRLQVNAKQLLADPEAHRGAVVRIVGRLEQRSALERLYQDTEEWFVRTDADVPVLVFLSGIDEADDWREGNRVEVFARFYKRIDAIDRQGQERQYAAFVGAHPRLVRTAAAGGAVQLWVVALPVLALLVAFAFLLIFVRRQRGERAPTRRATLAMPDGELDDERDLPDDPAEALAELRRRAEQP